MYMYLHESLKNTFYHFVVFFDKFFEFEANDDAVKGLIGRVDALDRGFADGAAEDALVAVFGIIEGFPDTVTVDNTVLFRSLP